MKKRLVLWAGAGWLILSLIIPFTSIRAADFRSTDSSGNITLDKSIETKNLFIAGNELNIETKAIQKDLFAFGMNIHVDTHVEQGTFIAGKDVEIRGWYGGNLFAAGSTISIDAEVMGDVFLFCNQWSIKQGAVIHGDVYVGSGTGYLDGMINGTLNGGGNEFYLNGTVEKATKLTVVKTLTIGERAKLALLQYQAVQEAKVMDGAQIQTTEFTPTETVNTAKQHFRFPVIGYLASLLFSLLLVFWMRKLVKQTITTIQQQFFACLGIGFAVLVSVPIAAFFLFLTMIGYKIALASLLFYGLCFITINPIAGIWLGEWVLRLFKKTSDSPSWMAALIGITLMQFIAWIPIIGFVVLAFLGIFSFGGLMISLFHLIKQWNES